MGALRSGDDAASGTLTRPQKSPAEGGKLRTQLPFLKLRTPALAGKKGRPGGCRPFEFGERTISLAPQSWSWRLRRRVQGKLELIVRKPEIKEVILCICILGRRDCYDYDVCGVVEVKMESYFGIVLNDVHHLNYEESTMSGKVLSLLATAALLASVGAANAEENAAAKAKGPVTLTDNQLDNVTAGAATNQVAFLMAISAADVSRLTAISNFTIGFLNGVPQPLSLLFTP